MRPVRWSQFIAHLLANERAADHRRGPRWPWRRRDASRSADLARPCSARPSSPAGDDDDDASGCGCCVGSDVMRYVTSMKVAHCIRASHRAILLTCSVTSARGRERRQLAFMTICYDAIISTLILAIVVDNSDGIRVESPLSSAISRLHRRRQSSRPICKVSK